MRNLLWLVCFQLFLSHVCTVVSGDGWVQAQTPSGGTGGGGADSIPAGKTLIEAQIATNWVERGITQTESSPAIHAALGYRWPQFKVGVWGSNYRVSPGEDNVNLRIFGAYKFIITSNLDITARADLSNYFSAGRANGNIMSVDFNAYTYHVDLEQVDNWEGTQDKLMRFAFRKEFILGTSWIWGLRMGYNSPSASTVVGYLDFHTSFGYKLQDMRIDLAASLTTNVEQLAGRGKPAVYILFSVIPE